MGGHPEVAPCVLTQECEMNIGTIINKALIRAQMSISDVPTRDMACDMLDEVIQSIWHRKKWLFRKATFNFTTDANIDEYALHQLAGEILPNTVRGSDSIRIIRFRPSTDFHKRHPHTIPTGDPYEYREGEMWGVQTQPSASSQISVASSLANYTTGTMTAIFGSRQITIAVGAFTLDMVGRWIRIGTESKRYRIASYISSTQALINDPYEGTTGAGKTFAIGDVQQKVSIQGFADDGTVIEEELQLNGTTSVTSTNFFASLNRITKSDKTYGTVTATSNAGAVTNIVLSPGETEADFRTIKLYPIPAKAELITYESYARHPYLHRSTDSPLFPSQWHPLLVIELYIKLMTEFLEKDVSAEVLAKRDQILTDMVINDNDSDEWHIVQETEYQSIDRNRSNLPENFGIGYGDFSFWDTF